MACDWLGFKVSNLHSFIGIAEVLSRLRLLMFKSLLLQLLHAMSWSLSVLFCNDW